MPQDPFDDIVRGYDQQFAPPKVKPVKPAKPPSFDDLIKDVDGQAGSVPTTRREQLRRSVTGLQNELTAATPQLKPGNTLNVTTGRQYPTPPPPPFQSPIDMRLNAPNEAQKAFDRAAAAIPAPQAPAPRPRQTLGQMRQQAGRFTPPEPSLQPVTPEQRKQKSEQFITALAEDKVRQQAAAKAKLEEEASRASQSTLGKMGTRFARGAVRGVTQTPFEFVQMANPDPVVRQTMGRIADDSKEWQSQNLPVDNRNPATLNVFKPEFYSLENVGKAATENIPEVLGEMLPQMALARGAGGVARAATAIPRIAPTTAAEFAEQAAAQLAARKGAELAARTAAGGYGAAQQSTQAYQKALDAGMTPEQAARAAAIEAPIGFSEFLGSPGTTGFTRPGTTIRREMREEGLQELGQTAASGLAGKYASGYDANKPLLDIAGESIGGGLLGAATGGIVATPGARLQARQQANQQRTIRSAIDQRSAANAAAIAPQPAAAQPVTEPLTEPMAAQPQPSAPASPQAQPQGFPRLPEPEGFNARRAKLLGMPTPAEVGINEQVQAAAQLLDSTNEGDQRQGRRMLNKALTDLRKAEGYLAEAALPPDAPRPFTAVRDAIEARLKPAPKVKEAPANQVPSSSAVETAQPTASNALRAEADAAKIKAAEFEQVGDFTQAAATYQAAHQNLKRLRRSMGQPKTPEAVAQINQIDREISIADANRRKANQAARTAQRQANAPTVELSTKKSQSPSDAFLDAAQPATFSRPESAQVQSQQQDARNISGDISAPLLRPDAVQNPEPVAPVEERTGDTIDFTPKAPARKRGGMDTENLTIGGMLKRRFPEGVRLADKGEARNLGGREGNALVGLVNKNSRVGVDDVAYALHEEGLRLPDGRPFVENSRVVATEAEVLDFLRSNSKQKVGGTKSLERRLTEEEAVYNERQPFDQIIADVDAEPTNRLRDADYEGGELQRYSKPLEGQAVEREAFQPDTADLREVREFAKREPRTEQFTEEPPTAPLARRRQPIRPPAPASPRQVGNRPLSVDVAGTRTPTAMSPDFPRARREMVKQGREVEARLTEGQEKGEFGNVAEAMFKSNTPDVLHGQDSFFHDPDLKGKLGLTREAEMAEVRRELKTQLARSLGLSADEVSLSHIKPEVWRAWAKQKGLGREAVRKLEAGIARAERKQRATETNAAIVAEESRRAQSEVRQSAAEAEKPVKQVDSVTPDDVVRIALNAQEAGGSGRYKDFDYRVDRNGLVSVAHSVTGRDFGLIDLKTGEIVPSQSKYVERLNALHEHLKANAQAALRDEKIARLKDYPVKNAAEIKRLESAFAPPAKSIDAQIKDIRDLQKFDLIDDKEARRKIAALEAQRPKIAERRSEAMPERYTGRQLFENAQLTFRPARNRPATLVANDWGGAMLNRLLSEKFDVTTTDANFTIGAKDAKDLRDYLADAKASGIYEPAQVANMDAMLKQMDAAIADAEANQQDVAFVTRRPAEPISATKAKIRHEAAHLSQSRIAADLSALTGKNWLDSQPNAKDIHKELDRRGYAPETHDYEAAAFVASGDYGVFGMNLDQAAKFLSDYFGAVVEKHGKRALQKFGAIDPKLQPTLEAARRETETRPTENQRRSVEAAQGSERRIGAAGEARGSSAGVRTERRERRQEAAGSRPARRGQVLASGLGAFQNLFERDAKPKEAKPARPVPLPRNFNLADWSQKLYRDAMAAGLPKDARAKYDAAKTVREKNVILMESKLDSARESQIFDLIDRAQAAAEKNDGSALYDVLSDATDLMRKTPERGLKRVKDEVGNLVSLPRAIMASADVSAPLRQGAILTLPPSQWGKAAKATVRMFQAFNTAKYKEIGKEINLHEDAETARESGLYLSTDKSGLLTKKEEDFVSSWADKIPLVKQSEQAYKTYLDSLRMDSFARYKKSIDKTKGLTEEQKQKAYQAAAEWINTATGRGSLGSHFESAMPILSKTLFAPRYAASRIQILNPYTYAKNSRTPEGRAVLKNQMSDMVQYAGMVSLTLALASAAGATVGLDPEDPDFLKIKVGQTRYDVLAGLQQPMRLFYRIGDALRRRVTGEKAASRQTALDIGERYIRSKAAPIPSFIWDWVEGKDYPGRPFELKRAVLDRVVPLMWKDMADAYEKEGGAGAAKILPAAFGIGVQNYGERTGALKGSRFTKEAEGRGLKYDFIRQKVGEPEAIYKQRVQRVEGWMSEYGDKLLSHPRYGTLTAAQQEAAIESLRRRIGTQQNAARPRLGSLAPEKVIQSVLKSEATRPKREAGKLWSPPANRP